VQKGKGLGNKLRTFAENDQIGPFQRQTNPGEPGKGWGKGSYQKMEPPGNRFFRTRRSVGVASPGPSRAKAEKGRKNVLHIRGGMKNGEASQLLPGGDPNHVPPP